MISPMHGRNGVAPFIELAKSWGPGSKLPWHQLWEVFEGHFPQALRWCSYDFDLLYQESSSKTKEHDDSQVYYLEYVFQWFPKLLASHQENATTRSWDVSGKSRLLTGSQVIQCIRIGIADHGRNPTGESRSFSQAAPAQYPSLAYHGSRRPAIASRNW